jgi:alpha-ketoglutarate-dependent taurine dioxygenase
MSVTIENIKPLVGGIVRVDRDKVTDSDVVATCREALEDRGVLLLPQVHLTDQEQLLFTERMGERVSFTKRVPGGEQHGDLYKITLDKSVNAEPDYVLGTWFWHFDGATLDMPLPKASMLSARKVAASGGQTEFANCYAAYEHLPERDKQQYEHLQVIHRLEATLIQTFGQLSESQLARYRDLAVEMLRPLVWTHETGRKSLLLGSHADEVVGMTRAGGRSLLARLQEWAGQPDFVYSHDWREGDFVFWNNHGMLHRVTPYADDSGRTMHRTTITSDARPGAPLSTQQAA